MTSRIGCGLALGELIQDESEKKLLLAIRSEPSPRAAPSACPRWARRKHGLRAVFVAHMNFPRARS